jgi:16S rRNA processing protein RimM
MPERFVALATIGAPHGVKGELRVKSFATEPTGLGVYGPLFAEDGRTFEIERFRPLKGDMLVVKFRGVDDRNAAEALKGLSLGVERSALPAPEPDEFYYADLIGLAAFDAAGNALGRVAAVENHGAGDILEIARENAPSLLLPFTKAVVPDIDIAAGRIVVVPPTEIEVKPDRSEEEQT